jgi:hypothetical protein
MYSAKYILYWILSGFTFGEKMKKYSTQTNESKFKEIYNQYKSSGLPKEEFCKVYGYTKSTFYCWLQKQLKEVLSQLAWFKRKMFGSISEKYPKI